MALLEIFKKGSTSRSVTIKIIDATAGTPETGVVFDTLGIDLWYRREDEAVVSITEADLTTPILTDTWETGGFLEIGNGDYRLDVPDAAFIAGANHVDIGGTVTGMVVIGGRVKLIDVDWEDAVRGGMTALPAANADDAGGLPISDAGGLDMDGIIAAIVAGFPTHEHADNDPGGGGWVVTGTQTAGDSDSTWLNDATYWQIAGAAADGDGFGIRADQTYTLGTDVKANLLRVNAYETTGTYVLAWAYNYVTTVWDQLSDAITAISGAETDYSYILLREHQQASDGEVHIRFTSTDEATNKYLYLDQVLISTVSINELTAAEIAEAVWSHDLTLIRDDGAEFIAGHMVKRDIAIATDVATEDSTTSFTLTAGKTEADAYIGMLLEVRDEDAATREIETRRITAWSAGRVVTVDRAFSFTPTVGDHVHIHNKYADTNATSLAAAAVSSIVTGLTADGITWDDFATILLAALVGKATVAGQVVTYMKRDGVTGKVAVTHDADGNRTDSTIDPP